MSTDDFIRRPDDIERQLRTLHRATAALRAALAADDRAMALTNGQPA